MVCGPLAGGWLGLGVLGVGAGGGWGLGVGGGEGWAGVGVGAAGGAGVGAFDFGWKKTVGGLGGAAWEGGGGGGRSFVTGTWVLRDWSLVLGWVGLEIDGLGRSTAAMTSNFYLFLS